ncbi:cytochrome b pre-mRNA-processing protein 3 [Novosphingobium panipatense]|uniref:Cytochrome b pre-mRNA-processing protein 3 n=1 Tax=Novosphingobium panipatense TaxID=428991 RepID=A0ABY1QTB0_9SPHN|nr:cytochrome b pre-mRNA-processing protein 3 [Novosphingobium panipatense]
MLLNEKAFADVSLITRLLGKDTAARDAMRPLWHRVVEIAREKPWYAECGIADTVAGRFDAVTLVLSLILLRMERDKGSDDTLINPAARLAELFVDDMDGQLRQSGVGDLVVGKRMGKLMSVLGGRLGALREALPRGDDVLVDAIQRNVTLNDRADTTGLARRIRVLHAQIDALSDDDLLAARIAR